uniref:Uncharacterized protein C12orf40 homolog n=1 Tax=Geotrypetes seraphini TaxID=260995 RepID=A0A6P8SDB2_GEOSA|nr:uncharacterized protein C12orf40 homolog [Geotrypetes seraphini]
MNWVGGSRTRIMLKQERRRQKEFFEKKKLKSKMEMLEGSISPSKNNSVSLDLLNLYVVNQISMKKEGNSILSKAVHVDMNRGIKIPHRKCNVELPVSPSTIPSKICLDYTQNCMPQQGRTNKMKHLSKNIRNELSGDVVSEDSQRFASKYKHVNNQEDIIHFGNLFDQSNRGVGDLNFTDKSNIMNVNKHSGTTREEDLSFYSTVPCDQLEFVLSENPNQLIYDVPSENDGPFINFSNPLFITNKDTDMTSDSCGLLDAQDLYDAINFNQNYNDEGCLRSGVTIPEKVLFKDTKILRNNYTASKEVNENSLEKHSLNESLYETFFQKQQSHFNGSDVESLKSSQSPSYSPRDTESCCSSSSEMAEYERPTKLHMRYVKENVKHCDEMPFVEKNNEISAVKKESQSLFHRKNIPEDSIPCHFHNEHHLLTTEEENVTSDPPKSDSLGMSVSTMNVDYTEKKERCNVWTQTENCILTVKKIDVGIQCNELRGCNCTSYFISDCKDKMLTPTVPSNMNRSHTTGGQKTPTDETLAFQTAGKATNISMNQIETEYLTLDKTTVEVTTHKNGELQE